MASVATLDALAGADGPSPDAGSRAARPEAAPADAPDPLDDPSAQAAYTRWETATDGTAFARSALQLSGLWCAGCADLIEHALRAQAGVRAAHVHDATRRCVVEWEPSRTRLSALVAVLRGDGYDAVPDVAASARELRRHEARLALWRLFVAAFCMMQVMMYTVPLYVAAPGTLGADTRALLLWACWLLSLPVMTFAAAPLFRDALASLRRGRIGMDVPAALGATVTFVASSGATFDPGGIFGADAWFDSLTMFIAFLLAGRYVALKLRQRAAATLEDAVSRLPAVARRIEVDGRIVEIALARLGRGDRVLVARGEAFPADGPLDEGTTEADEALLTGEATPVCKRPGDVAIAGSLNLSAPVVQRVERTGPDTRYEGVVALLRQALVERPPAARAADRIAGPFLLAVLLLAALAGATWSLIEPGRALAVMVAVLIVTCPCALALAAPVATVAGAAALARRGMLVRRLDALEALARIDTVCFDKTGTLTAGRPVLESVEPQGAACRDGLDEAAVRAIAAGLAAASSHPLAQALAEPALRTAEPIAWTDLHEEIGAGLEGRAPAGRFRLGSASWVGATGTAASAEPEVWLGGPHGPLARFTFSEALRPGTRAALESLRRAGLRLMLLSGDAVERVRRTAERLGLEQRRGAATPEAKLATVAALQAEGRRVAMVGDGLNDAPVMGRADVSIALAEGAALTRAHADFVLLSGRLDDIGHAHAVARRTLRVIRFNLAWAATYNAVCVPLALAGWLPPWAAGLGMATSSLVVVASAVCIDRGRRSHPPHRTEDPT